MAEFIALNGMEVKKAILKQIERQMDADSNFNQNLSYARISWRWKLSTDTYPADVPKPAGAVSGELVAKDIPPMFVFTVPKHTEIEGEQTVAAPEAGITANQARRDAELPIPMVQRVAGPEGSQITVDAPKLPSVARESQDPGDDDARVQTKPTTGRGRVARVAAVATRANPRGVQAPAHAGNTPTAEDADRIIENGLADGTLEPRG